jgi:hypothetical protein
MVKVRINLQLFGQSITDIAKEVIQGKWGNGATRKERLTKKGYNYNKVQSEVNRLLGGNSSAKTTTSNKSSSNSNKNNNNNNNKSTPTDYGIKGADNSLIDASLSGPTFSDKTIADRKVRDDAAQKANDFFTNTDILPQSIKDTLSTPYQDSATTIAAWDYLKSKEAAMSSGKGKYTDLFDASLNKYLNRDKFEYDVDKDPLFQQALASAMNSGRTAMQDTIGQASALTGGYGSTYATSVGNQAYNQLLEDAYDNLPQYYQMALEAYQAEGQEMAQQVNLLAQADANDWNKNKDLFNMAADMYGFSVEKDRYAYESEQTQAMNMGTLLLDENRTIGSNYKSAYDIANDSYQNSLGIDLSTWENYTRTLTDIWKAQQNGYYSDKNLSISEAELGLKENEYKISTGDANGDGVLSAEERAAHTALTSGKDLDGDGVISEDEAEATSNYKLTETQLKKCKEILEDGGSFEEVLTYLDSVGNCPVDDPEDALLKKWLGLSGDDSTENSSSKKIKTKTGTVSTSSGSVSSFESDEGDNFDVTYKGETYRVENDGKVTDKNLISGLDKLDVPVKSVFVYQGDAYVKGKKNYYKIGATDFLWWDTDGYSDLLKAMTKSDK